ncbi:hypothetical protein [Sphingomonas jaspsi]|uniref:hypothetical protein n=1 Tax=Sphingomonas jaspsi TaxID=392409 RepID=UPI00055FCA66|nr:hypothetical protein [Sphingomonas jaspsi]
MNTTTKHTPAASIDSALADIQQLLSECCPASNKHERATVAIEALIIAGVCTHSEIVGAMRAMGFDYRHANILLKTMTGKASHHRWTLDGAGTYGVAAN